MNYPHIDPVAFRIGPLPVHWYGLMYLFGFIAGWVLLSRRAKRPGESWTSDQISDIIFYAALGVIIGARIGYMFFYQNLHWIVNDPLQLFRVWDGGMSFHGGLLGVMLALYVYKRKYGKGFFQVTDFMLPVVPIGLALGRVGNFINGELPGRIMANQHSVFGFIYPAATDERPYGMLRYPSSVIQFLMEGVLLFIVMWVFARKPRPRMAITGVFSLGYGCFRFLDEFLRAPDPQMGYRDFGLTRGQELCIPMIIFGLILLFLAYRKKRRTA